MTTVVLLAGLGEERNGGWGKNKLLVIFFWLNWGPGGREMK